MTGLDEFATLWAHWMFHAGWQVAVLVIVAFAILKLGRQRISSQLKYAILLIVLVKFATPPFLHFSTGLFSQPVVAQFSESTFVAYGEEQVNTVDLPVIDQPSSKTNMEADKDQRRSDLPIASTPADISQTKISGDAFSTNGFSWLSVGICVYLAGVLFFGLRLVFGWVNVRMAVSRSELQLSGDLVDEFSDLAGRLNLRNVPQLKLSGVVDSPFATGVFNSVVVLTKDVVHSLSPDQRRIVMAHELVHIRRRDQVVGVAEAVLGVVWWFHPAMWWLTRSLRSIPLLVGHLVSLSLLR